MIVSVETEWLIKRQIFTEILCVANDEPLERDPRTRQLLDTRTNGKRETLVVARYPAMMEADCKTEKLDYKIAG